MHPEHQKQVEAGYEPAAIRAAKAQLATAINSLRNTRGPAATHWVERIHQLVGTIRIAELGGSVWDACKLLERCRWFNYEFHEKTFDYTRGKISLSDYKEWLIPLTFQYQNLDLKHPVYDVKHLMAEHSSEHCKMTEDELKDEIRKVLVSKREELL